MNELADIFGAAIGCSAFLVVVFIIWLWPYKKFFIIESTKVYLLNIVLWVVAINVIGCIIMPSHIWLERYSLPWVYTTFGFGLILVVGYNMKKTTDSKEPTVKNKETIKEVQCNNLSENDEKSEILESMKQNENEKPIDAQERSDSETTIAVMKFCPECGVELIPEVKYCHNCGRKI